MENDTTKEEDGERCNERRGCEIENLRARGQLGEVVNQHECGVGRFQSSASSGLGVLAKVCGAGVMHLTTGPCLCIQVAW